ncbi:MAG TPA: hypothetical protein VG965_04015 [Patescibacteria group bacterium]|nr:hypothetical protein [Patescibacteria group bacterium]
MPEPSADLPVSQRTIDQRNLHPLKTPLNIKYADIGVAATKVEGGFEAGKAMVFDAWTGLHTRGLTPENKKAGDVMLANFAYFTANNAVRAENDLTEEAKFTPEQIEEANRRAYDIDIELREEFQKTRG